jgi:tRNA U34 5-methylaminomethyl-2-thiouridine-forming methyltransferase MnmC
MEPRETLNWMYDELYASISKQVGKTYEAREEELQKQLAHAQECNRIATERAEKALAVVEAAQGIAVGFLINGEDFISVPREDYDEFLVALAAWKEAQ